MFDHADSTLLSVFPRFGNELGGTTVQFSGPCLEVTDIIIYDFDDEETAGVYISQVTGICITPPLERVGWVTLNVTVVSGDDNQTVEYSNQTRFYSGTTNEQEVCMHIITGNVL